MYLCLCKGITKQQVQHTIQKKNLTLRQLQNLYQIGKSCGSCLEQLEEVINETKRDLIQRPKS
jgi:bacterioferritin-associated ferredoxin